MRDCCLACGGRILYPLYEPDPQPLAALNLPRSAEAAQRALRFPIDFRVCAYCGHIFNTQFDYYKIPYADDSNLMYNGGSRWLGHLEGLVDLLLTKYDALGKTLVDIGCGDGRFLELLREKGPACRCIGFEPGIEANNARAKGFEVQQDYFHPERDLLAGRPDFLLCRHVIEHLADPRGFVAAIAYWCNLYELFPVLLAEVPRIEKAVEGARVVDFLYEHVSNFTDFSFRVMFESTGFEVLELRPCYGDEVVVAVVQARKIGRIQTLRHAAEAFRQRIDRQLVEVRGELRRLRAEGRTIAFWGGTGKGAAFLNAFRLAADEFPLVVDSDCHKVGRYVPATAQEIRSPDYLVRNPADVIVITTRWRAGDILEEIRQRGIRCETVLMLEGGQLRPCAGLGRVPE
ncbi:MAG: methyltransferase domain-containing protein [Pirellulales bacterium]|nr:methyltransferase domain-containing protein [Pirellulales bacterium]